MIKNKLDLKEAQLRLENSMKEKQIYKDLSKLIGYKVIKVEPNCKAYYTDLINSEDNGYIITFSNGIKLTAIDGEYGDNAFEFIK